MNANNLVGICLRCKEWTDVHNACCGSLVECEGHAYDPCDFCEKCGEELDHPDKSELCYDCRRQKVQDRLADRFDRMRDAAKDRKAVTP